jgi:hypothetical protein
MSSVLFLSQSKNSRTCHLSKLSGVLDAGDVLAMTGTVAPSFTGSAGLDFTFLGPRFWIFSMSIVEALYNVGP